MPKHEKMFEYITPDGQKVLFPVATIKGNKSGPHVVITAGLHGTEYPPIAAAIELYKTINPIEVSGTITIVTVSNIKAFEERTMFVTPVDGKNPNRFFPGQKDGSYTECLVYYLFHDVIAKGDLHMDLHCGDLIEALTPFAEYSRGTSKEVEQKSSEIALYYGLPNVVGVEVDLTKPVAGQNYENSARHGIASALLEVGQRGILDRHSVDAHLFGIKNVLRHFGIISGIAAEPREVEIFDGIEEITTKDAGIFYCYVEPGDWLKKGQIVGRIEDYFGHMLSEVCSPADGKILYMTANPAMLKDNFILDMAIKNP